MIHDKIVAYCREHNISIMAFEKKCGLANTTVGNWENDKLKPSLSSLTKNADATGIPIADWLDQR